MVSGVNDLRLNFDLELITTIVIYDFGEPQIT